MSEPEIKLAILGAAGRGGSYFGAAARLAGVKLAAACDINAPALAEVARKWNIPLTFASFDELLDARVADAVIIGTPQHLHTEQAVAALDAGLHVLSEVPAAVSLDQARALAAAAARAPGTYMLAENSCFLESNVLVRELARAGLFGEPYYGEGHYLHELKALNELTPWRRRWQTGIDGNTYITHELGPLLHWLPGQRVVAVSAAGCGHHYRDPRGQAYEIQDNVLTWCRLSGGGLLELQLDMLSERPHKLDYWRLQGTLGAYESPRLPSAAPMVALRDRPRAFDDRSELPWRPLAEFRERFLPERHRRLAAEAAATGHGGSDFFVLDEFIAALRQGRRPLVDIHGALDMTLPGIISQQAIAASGWLDVPDSRTWV